MSSAIEARPDMGAVLSIPGESGARRVRVEIPQICQSKSPHLPKDGRYGPPETF
jgi:hypothetical protein